MTEIFSYYEKHYPGYLEYFSTQSKYDYYISGSKELSELPERIKEARNKMRYSQRDTIFLLSQSKPVKARIEECAKDINCKVFYGAPSSPDIIAIPYFVAVVDRELLGEDAWNDYVNYSDEAEDETPIIIVDDKEWELPKHNQIITETKKDVIAAEVIRAKAELLSSMLGFKDLKRSCRFGFEVDDNGQRIKTRQCPVKGCGHEVKIMTESGPNLKSDKSRLGDYFCPQHEIYISPSTFEYSDYLRNILWNDNNDIVLFENIKRVKRYRRYDARENSEDMVTWNVFRFLERNDQVSDYLEGECNTAVKNPELIY